MTQSAIHDASASNVEWPGVDVIVLNWNGKDDTLACLGSLGRLAYPNVHITVVDNGSEDGSVAAIRARFPSLELIETGRNLGYAGGNNVGLRASLAAGRADYVLVLNNDTEVDEALLHELVEAARVAPPLAVLGPNIFYRDEPESVWFAGASWLPSTLKFEYAGFRRPIREREPAPRETDYVTGCALFTSVETLREVGLLDERFFLVYEEVEWCYRLRKLGGRCLVVPGAKLWHRVSASFGGEGSPLIHYFTARNELLWAERSLSPGQHLRLLAGSIAAVLLPEVWFKHRPPAPLLKRMYWSIRSRSAWDASLYRDRTYRSRVAGLRDYILRRFGDCPDAVRRAA